jgi:hypothetical protein
MAKDEALIITGKGLKAESMSEGRKPYYMDRHEASIHMWALDALEAKSDLEKEGLELERKRFKDYYQMRWP